MPQNRPTQVENGLYLTSRKPRLALDRDFQEKVEISLLERYPGNESQGNLDREAAYRAKGG
jgi:hypothetical protein